MEAFIDVVSGTAVLPGLALVTTYATTKTTGSQPAAAKQTNVKTAKNKTPNLDNAIAKWGANNNFPLEVIADCEKNPELASSIYWKANAIISGGLVYGKLVIENGQEKLIPVKDTKVEAWLKRTNVKRYLRESAHEFYKFWNIWPTLVMSTDKKSIASIACQESAFCRWGLQDKQGNLNQVYISANWELVKNIDAENLVQLPALDPYYDPKTNLEALVAAGHLEFTYPVAGTSSGKMYYQLAPWNAIRNSGWLQVANAVPVYKAAIMKNLVTAKYHIEVPDYFFEWKYPNWKQLNPAEQKALQQKEYQQFTDFVTGAENAGKCVFTAVRTDPNTKQAFAGWKITALDDKVKSGAYIEDSQEASSHIFFSQGIDSSLIGQAPGKGMGAGSGSDKRVAYNIWIANSKPEQDLLLEPLDFIFDYNNFCDPETKEPYTLWFKNYWITTLDAGKETTPTDK